MPYTINKTNGLLLTTVQDGTIDNTTSLTLVGRNYTGYGSPVDENFVYLLENFANATSPNNPLTGQLWYDSSNNRLNIYNGSIFKSLGIVDYGNQFPLGANPGDLHFDSVQKILYAYNGNDWTAIGPLAGSGSGGSLSPVTVYDTNSLAHVVVEIPISSVTATIISTLPEFAVKPTESVHGAYPVIYPGINLPNTNNLGISGYYDPISQLNLGNLLWGTAASALGLVDDTGESPVLIRSSDLITSASLSDFFADYATGIIKLHQTTNSGNPVANISVIPNNAPLNINLNTNAGIYTNVLQINDANGLQVLPAGTLNVALGSSSNYFSTLYVNTVSSNVVVANSVISNAVYAPLASVSIFTATLATISQELFAGQVQASGVNSPNVTATNITSSIINSGQIYDTNARVLTTATIASYGVTSLAGTANQIAVSASKGSVTLSLPSSVTVASLTSTNNLYAAGTVYSNGLPCLTSATIPGSGVTNLIGTANQILVNGTSGSATTGSITLTLASPLKDSGGNSYLTAATGVTSFAGGTTGLTPTNTTNGAITLAGTLSSSNGGTGNAGTLSGIPYANGSSAWSNATSAQLASALGTFTSNYVIRANSSGVLTSSVIYDNGTNVGIGQTSPGAKLDVSGNIRLSAASPNIEFNNGGAMVYSTIGNTLQFATGGGPGSPTEYMRLDASGNLHLYGGLYVTTSGLLKGNGSSSAVTAASASDITGTLGYAPLHNVTAGYTGSSVYVQTTAPYTSGGTPGDIWLDTSGGTGFSQSLGTNGWVILPGGLLMQWGQDRQVTNVTGTLYTTNFPKQFSATPYSITVGRYAGSTETYNQKHYIRAGSSTTGFTWYISDDDSGNSNSYVYGFDWFAIGPA